MKEIIIRLLIPLLSLTDMLLTYWTIKTLSIMNPKKDVTTLEMNGMTRMMWKHFGLKKGSIIQGTISVVAFSFVAFYFNMNFIFFLLGVLCITNLIHFNNTMQIRNSKEYSKLRKKYETKSNNKNK